jgi:hypothetical protein
MPSLLAFGTVIATIHLLLPSKAFTAAIHSLLRSRAVVVAIHPLCRNTLFVAVGWRLTWRALIYSLLL